MNKEEDIMNFMLSAFTRKAYKLSIHAYGCRVIQRLLEFCDESMLRPLIDEILPNVASLSEDQ